ncbi:MAG: GIY-YIG nuclease family protein [bacterium]
MKKYYVYMMTNKYNNVLYMGITNDLIRRVYEHKNGSIGGFTKKYNCHKLVWFQETSDVTSAITQEKKMKKLRREYKENVINELNPEWKDLYDVILQSTNQ